MIHNFVRSKTIKILLAGLLCTSIANNNYSFFKSKKNTKNQKLITGALLIAAGTLGLGLCYWLYKKYNTPNTRLLKCKHIIQPYTHNFFCRIYSIGDSICAQATINFPVQNLNYKLEFRIIKETYLKIFHAIILTLQLDIAPWRDGLKPFPIPTRIEREIPDKAKDEIIRQNGKSLITINPKKPEIIGIPGSDKYLKAIIYAIQKNEKQLLKENSDTHNFSINITFQNKLTLTKKQKNDSIEDPKERTEWIKNEIFEKEPFKIKMRDSQNLLANKIFLYN